MTMKEKIQNREIVLGTMLSEISTPNVVRIMKTAGFEFMIVDCEHGYFDFSQLSAITSIANGFGMTLIVRVPSISKEFITRVLDMGVDGILVPMVNTVEDARHAVALTKYPPMGTRGISTTRAHTNYAPPPLHEYVEIANKHTIVFVQIESQEGVNNVDEIAAVEGVDALMVGPNDMAMDFGHPGNLEMPDITAAIERVVEAANKVNKPSGIIDSRINFLHKWQQKGMRVFSCGSEVGMMMDCAKKKYKEFYQL